MSQTSFVNISAPSLPDPASVSGLIAWYRMDDVVLNGTTVQQLNDLSGNGRHLSNTVVSQQPAYTSSDAGINGKPSAFFWGKILKGSSWVSVGSQVFHAFVIHKHRDTTNQRSLFNLQKGLDTNNTVWLEYNNGYRMDAVFPTWGAWFGSPSIASSANVWQTVEGIWGVSGKQFQASINNGTITNQGSPNRTNNSFDTTTIGARLNGSGGLINNAKTDYAEIIVYDHQLIQSDRDIVYSYISTRYAI